jgi:predicted AlkP superfamily phosphohydrolase/phosphomutase
MGAMARFLLIGLDGLDPDLTLDWAGRGLLPCIARLMERGTFLQCRSTVPPVTLPAWTTCVTGVNPGKHGVFDFTAMLPGAYAIRFVNGTQRRVPALWNVLSEAGLRTGVLGVPGTWPPEPVNGFMVSGFDSPVASRVDRSFVHPPELYGSVAGWRFAAFQEGRTGGGWHARALPALLAKIGEKRAIALDLLTREPWDFFMVVFGESDTASHHFWMYHDPKSPRHRPGMEDALLRVYRALDAAVGELADAAGPDTVVGIVSDHGFRGAGTGVIHLNNWLAERGHLTFTPAAGSPLKAAALGLVPHRWRGALFRRFRETAARAESRARFAGIDWGRTRAYSEELGYAPSIRVNLAGREPLGTVRPGDYKAYCADLCAELKAWGPVARAVSRREVYDGPWVADAPDILIEPAAENGYPHACLRARGGPSFRRLRPGEHAGGKERGMNGVHRPEGVLVLSEKTTAGAATLEDVAPTVLAVLGVPAPPMDGTPLLGTLTEAGAEVSELQAPVPSDEAGEAAVAERLRALGYLE